MADPYVGEIRIWGPNFEPRGWAFCDGRLLQIASNPALFSILGTTYGGDGRTTFALPDLSGRAACHPGQGPGLSPKALGQRFGQAAVTLTVEELPAHTHPAVASGDPATAVDPTNRFPGATAEPAYAPPDGAVMAPTGPAGGGQPHDNLPPYLVLRYIIALSGIFPDRG